MKTASLFMEHPAPQELRNNDAATVVALQRKGEDDLLLRFVMSDVSWDVHSREIRLNKDLAENLLQMLADELD